MEVMGFSLSGGSFFWVHSRETRRTILVGPNTLARCWVSVLKGVIMKV